MIIKDCDGMFAHWCPGCEGLHYIPVVKEGGPVWTFDGNLEMPTFNPSVRIQYNGSDAGEIREDGRRAPAACCHYFIRAGQIEFCGDSTHAFAGRTVPLPEIP